MNRYSVICWAACVLAPTQGLCQGVDSPMTPVVEVADPTAASKDSKTAVIGSLGGDGDGHVVIRVPGSSNVWDGNTLGGLKDLAEKNTVTNHSVLERMNNFLKMYSQKRLSMTRSRARRPRRKKMNTGRAWNNISAMRPRQTNGSSAIRKLALSSFPILECQRPQERQVVSGACGQ